MAAIGAGVTLLDTSYILLLGAAHRRLGCLALQRWRQVPTLAELRSPAGAVPRALAAPLGGSEYTK